MRGEETIFHTMGHQISGNTIVRNRENALALWWDNDFFGPHPNQAGKFKSPALWKAHLREIADRVYDPAAQKLSIDQNFYDARAKFLFGAPWRKDSSKPGNACRLRKTHGIRDRRQ
jgi:hypothetical protein